MNYRRMLIIAVTTCGVVAQCRGHEPTSVVLTYELSGCGTAVTEKFDTQKLAAALNQRIGKDASAKALDDSRFQIEIYGKHDSSGLDAIKKRIGGGWCLELRILADTERTEDLPIIKQAKALQADKQEVISDGTKVAAWVRFNKKDFGPVDKETYGMVKQLRGGVPQTLVLMDDANVTGESILFATKVTDNSGHSNIKLALTEEGGKKLHDLTGQNLPGPSTPDACRHLGIVLDKQLLSAVVIRSVISDRATISGGSMTNDEIDAIVDSLNRGLLPRVFRLVDEKVVTEKK